MRGTRAIFPYKDENYLALSDAARLLGISVSTFHSRFAKANSGYGCFVLNPDELSALRMSGMLPPHIPARTQRLKVVHVAAIFIVAMTGVNTELAELCRNGVSIQELEDNAPPPAPPKPHPIRLRAQELRGNQPRKTVPVSPIRRKSVLTRIEDEMREMRQEIGELRTLLAESLKRGGGTP